VPNPMNRSEAASQKMRPTEYDMDLIEKLRKARSGFGWAGLLLAFGAGVPSLYLGLRGHGWIWWPTVLLAALSVVNLLSYRRYTRRLENWAILENAPKQPPDPTPAPGTPPSSPTALQG